MVTRAQLVAQDGNDDFDVYDARVGGVQPPVAPECSGTGCQGTPAQSPVFATPASETFSGVGNFPPPAPAKPAAKPKAKPLTRAQKLTKALKACRAKGNKHARSSCEARARRQYKPLVKKK